MMSRARQLLGPRERRPHVRPLRLRLRQALELEEGARGYDERRRCVHLARSRGRGESTSVTTISPTRRCPYATCNGDCTVPLGWTRTVLDGAIHNVGLFTSLTARNGVVNISFYDGSHGDLKFLRRSPLSSPF